MASFLASSGWRSATYQGDADYVLYSEFDSAEALAGYQVHPDHVAAKEVVHKYVATRMAADYEY